MSNFNGNNNGNNKDKKGGLWVNTAKSGMQYFNIIIDGKNYVAFPNNYKDNPKKPDFVIMPKENNNFGNNNNNNEYNKNFNGYNDYKSGNNEKKYNPNFSSNVNNNMGDYSTQKKGDYNFTNGEDEGYDPSILSL